MPQAVVNSGDIVQNPSPFYDHTKTPPREDNLELNDDHQPSTLDELFKNLSEEEQLETCDILLTIYNSSSQYRELYYDLLKKREKLLETFNYHDTLASLNNTVKSTQKRHKDNGGESLPSSDNEGKASNAKEFVSFFPKWNFERLLFLRFKRLSDAIAEALESDALKDTVDKINPGLSVLGVAWYLPRFFRHSFLLMKHLLNGNTHYAKKYAFLLRNDTAWIVTGVLTAGPSTGWYLNGLTAIFGPGAFYLTVALYLFDMANQAWDAHCTIDKLNQTLDHLDCNIKQTEQAIKNLQIDQQNQKKIIENLKQTKTNAPNKAEIIDNNIRSIEDKSKKTQDTISEKQTLLSELKETKSKIEGRKRYEEYNQLVKIGVTVGLFAGMLTSVFMPILGASIVLATCAAKAYAEKYYLPKQEVRFCHDPLELLHHRLMGHVEQQITRLEKEKDKLAKFKKSSLKNISYHINTNRKLTAYQDIYQKLIKWQNGSERDERTEIALLKILDNTQNASKITRDRKIEPDSYKALKEILNAFDVDWETSKEYECKNTFIGIIHSFVNEKPQIKEPPFTLFDKDNNPSFINRVRNTLQL
ncbi:hypothetical protein L3V79_03965 [Thiotrichales bacterium 19S9-12]|nr:hypothetical protein [Thiotrichales bacterium 19S9-11]MCF6811513.1 hypothetical protein [Thiotrichales bacterium 19S9-12]